MHDSGYAPPTDQELAQQLPDAAAPSYAAWHAQMLRLYLVPALGHHRLNVLAANHVLAFRNHLQQHLSPRSVRSVMKILERAMDQSVESRKVAYNPCVAIKVPKVPHSSRTAFSVEQIRALLAAVEGTRYAPIYAIMAILGLRIGEALALRGIDFTSDFTEVKINQAIGYLGLLFPSEAGTPIQPRNFERTWSG